MTVNRREHLRYPVEGDEIFVLGRHSRNVAAVRNISIGGLQFEYVNGAYESDHWTQIDIIGEWQDRLTLPCLECQIVYDIKTLLESGTYTGLDVRCCGVRFVGLTEDQKKNLHQVLRCLASQPVE